MSVQRSPAARQRSIAGAFHEYVRGVFAERSTRARVLRVNRMRWLSGFAPLRTAQRREGEGR